MKKEFNANNEMQSTSVESHHQQQEFNKMFQLDNQQQMDNLAQLAKSDILSKSNMLKENFLLKNARSSSLPLKIMIKKHNDQKQKDKIDSDNRLIKSWNDTNSILNRSFDQISNSNGFYLTCKLSISEHFLDLIEQEEPKLFMNQDLFYAHPKRFDLFSLTRKSPNQHTYNSRELNKYDIQSSENIDRQELDTYSSSSSESIKTITNDENTNSNAKEMQYQVLSDSNNNLIKSNQESSNELSSNREMQDKIESQKPEELNNEQVELKNDGNNQVQSESEKAESNLLISNDQINSLQEKEKETHEKEENSLDESDDGQEEASTISLSSNDQSICNLSENASSSGFSSSFSEMNLSSITNSTSISLSDQSDSLSKNLSSDSINSNNNNRNNDTTINFDNDITLSSSCQDVVDNLSLSNSSSSSSFENELKMFMPKKSCLKPKLFIDTSSTGNIIDSAYATSSPLSSPFCSSTTCSSLEQSSALNSPTISNSSLSTNSSSSTKKRVSFADASGKELFTVRTMSEPSNCPPKLTSKIVQYFLNREFSSNSSNCLTNGFGSSNNFFDLGSNYNFDTNRYNYANSERNCDYGISTSNYSNDVSKMSGSIAVYTLNFNQPASDYLRFRNILEEKFVSLENVVLNRFQINGTIKVKNINFHKQVYVRCSFNSWHSYEDIHASFVPCDFYTSAGSVSPTQTHISPTFYASNHSNYQPYHKEYDTFKFEFQLPKNVDESNQKSSSKDQNNKSNASASIQFCICFKSGAGSDEKEYWDSNNGLNYEILQYIIDIEKLKPSNKQQQQQSTANNTSINNKSVNNKSNQFKYDVSSYSSKMNYVGCLAQENQITGVYY